MKIKAIDWHDLVEQVRFWDALDLLDNLEQEMDRARCGLVHCVFGPSQEGLPPLLLDEMRLSPEIRTYGDRVIIEFCDLKNVEKEDIDVTIDSGLLDVIVTRSADEEREHLGRFMMRIPPDTDMETCEAEFKGGRLVICLKKVKTEAKKRIEIK